MKISQMDNKTSLDLAISRIRTWGASNSTFFLELGMGLGMGLGVGLGMGLGVGLAVGIITKFIQDPDLQPGKADWR